MAESITLTDQAGDTLEVTPSGDYVFIDADEGEQHTEIQLESDQAIELGRALLGDDDSFEANDALDTNRAPTEREAYNMDALKVALDYGRLAVFQYEKGKGSASIEKRRVKPDEAYRSGDGDPIVVGFDPDRGGTRAFRLDRIVGHVRIG